MGLVEFIRDLKESERYPSGRGSYKTTANSPVSPQKSKVTNFETIEKGLSKSSPGKIFSTKGSRRLYVTSQSKWGKKSTGKIAKGFTPGSSTPSSSFSSIKAHASRVKQKHGGGSSSTDDSLNRHKETEKKKTKNVKG